MSKYDVVCHQWQGGYQAAHLPHFLHQGELALVSSRANYIQKPLRGPGSGWEKIAQGDVDRGQRLRCAAAARILGESRSKSKGRVTL